MPLISKNCKQNISHGPLDTRYGKLAFTLVELIVVIVILGILGTIGFLAFGNYPKQARDVVRVSNLNELEDALEFYKIDNGDYPLPTDYTTGTIEGFTGITWYKGKFGEDIASKIKSVVKTPLDPKTKSFYNYDLSENLKFYRITANLELKNEETGKNEYIVKNKLGKPQNCNDIKIQGRGETNGNYDIYPNGTKITVYCDLESDGFGWTRYVKINSNYTFENAKKCWLGDIISTANLECFNPNRFGMIAKKFKIIHTINGIKKVKIHKNYFPNPSVNSKYKIGPDEFGRYVTCLGGEDYMSIARYGEDIKSDGTDALYVWLGFSACIKSKNLLGWNLGGMVGGSYNKYMNKGNNWEFDVNPLEIYIK